MLEEDDTIKNPRIKGESTIVKVHVPTEKILTATDIICDECSSKNVKYIEFLDRLPTMRTKTFMYFFDTLSNVYNCQECGNVWKKTTKMYVKIV